MLTLSKPFKRLGIFFNFVGYKQNIYVNFRVKISNKNLIYR